MQLKFGMLVQTACQVQKLAGPIAGTAKRDGTWTSVDLRDHNIVVDGDFYMVYIQTKANPNAPGLATDESSHKRRNAAINMLAAHGLHHQLKKETI